MAEEPDTADAIDWEKESVRAAGLFDGGGGGVQEQQRGGGVQDGGEKKMNKNADENQDEDAVERVVTAEEAGASPAAAAAAEITAEEARRLEQEIIDAYEAAMQEWREQEAALDAKVEMEETKLENKVREARKRGTSAAYDDAIRRERQWIESDPDLEAYAKVACTQSIHHKPVYVPGKFIPPIRAPSVKIPGTPPVLIPGTPAFWEPGRAPFYTPGFWTPGKLPRYIGAKHPVIIPAKKGVVIPGEFTPASYTPGFVIPGFHETTACAVPAPVLCSGPGCNNSSNAAPVIQPDIINPMMG